MIRILYVHGYHGNSHDPVGSIAGGHHLSEAGARKIMTEIAPALFFGK